MRSSSFINKYAFFLLICFFSAVNTLIGQEKNTWVLNRILNVDNGLPQNTVNDLYFDHSTGFLWIATEGGLVRYNGKSTKNFEISNIPAFRQPRMSLFTKTIDNEVMVVDRACTGVRIKGQNPENKYSVSLCETVQTVFYGAPASSRFQRNPSYQTLIDSGLASAYKKLIEKLGPQTGMEFATISYTNDSTALVMVNDAAFIVGKNLYNFNVGLSLSNRAFMHFPPGNRVVAVNGDTFSGYLLDIDNKTATPLHPASPGLLEGSPHIYSDQMNMINYVLSGNKLYKLLLKNDKLEWKLIAQLPDLPDNIKEIAVDEKENQIYIGTTYKGLYIYTRSFFYTYRFTDPKMFSGKKGTPYTNAIENIYASVLADSNHILIGSLKSGVEPSHNLLLLNLDNGHFDLPFPWPALPFSLTIDKEKRFYFSSNNLRRYRYGSGPSGKPDSFSVLSGPVYYDSKYDKVWAITYLKNDMYYIKGDTLYEFMRYHSGPVEKFLNIKRTNDILVTFTDSVLYRVDETNKKLEKIYSFNLPCLRDVYIDQDSLAWISTYGKGLFMYDLKTRKVYYPKRDTKDYLRFSHNVIDDGLGNFFIPTNNGLFRVNRKLLIEAYKDSTKPLYYHYYDKTNGLLQNEFNGGGYPGYNKMNNGDILLPSMRGLVRVFTSAITIPNKFPLFINSVTTPFRTVEFSQDQVFDQKERVLDLELNFAEWEFHDIPGLSYQLNNEKTWTFLPSGERKIRLANLAGGSHTLRIRNQFDLAGNEMSFLTVNFYIKKKYYEKTWFWILLSLFLFGVIYVVAALRNIQLKRKNIELERKIHRKTLDVKNKNAELEDTLLNLNVALEHLEQNSRFQQKLIGLLGHDIMTPLQYIAKVAKQVITYREKLSEETRTGAIREIGNTATQLLYLGESLIHWLKLQEGDFIPHYSSFRIHSIVEELVHLHQPIAAEKGNLIKNEIPEDLFCVQEPVIVRIVLHNLLLNANKFTTKGAITISGELKDKMMVLTVIDTGTGMDSDLVADLNNLKVGMTKKGTENEKGWGLGYRFIIDLIRFVNGKFSVSSEKGKGTRVMIQVPCRNGEG